MKDRLYLILVLAIPFVALSYYLLQEIRIAKSMGFPLDDAWIFWVFAKNLATGQGFSFNPGDPVLGTTSILWVLLLSGSYLFSENAVLISKFWGIAIFLAALLLTYRICLFHTRARMVALIGVLTFALTPAAIFGALSGMEISLATLLVCLTLYYHLKERGKVRKVFLAPVFGGLCFAARPELVTLYPLLLMHDYLKGFWMRGQAGSRSARAIRPRKLLTYLVFLCPTFLFSHLVTGSLLPHTLAAKTLDSGLMWAVRNGNLHEALVSLTLNPLVWGGCMLVLLVYLNPFWGYFWSKGLGLSFLKRDALLYPVIFLMVPMVRGIMAPVSNPLLMAQRYVSFLFPVLAVFFVIGWQGIKVRSRAKAAFFRLRGWLFLAAAISLILSFVFYLGPLVQRDILVRFFAGYWFPQLQNSPTWLNFSDFKFILWFAVLFVSVAGLFGAVRLFLKRTAGRAAVFLLLMAGAALQIAILANRSELYSLSVKNINEADVRLGKWMNRKIPQGSLVAINDVGAIRFFGNRECLDLEGLVSPQMIPYKILGAESYIVYLNKHRPDYFIIFPSWYPPLMRFLSLKEGILHEIWLEDNVILGGQGHAIVARPDWRFFDNALQNSGLLDIEPYTPRKSLKRRWYDAQERQGLFPDWRMYHLKGKEAERGGDLDEAKRLYLKAESYDPQHHEFYIQMAVFYERRGDHARSMAALRKSTQYQLFPPPPDSDKEVADWLF
jgi:tetratricopeptide (TPR) repeat protein